MEDNSRDGYLVRPEDEKTGEIESIYARKIGRQRSETCRGTKSSSVAEHMKKWAETSGIAPGVQDGMQYRVTLRKEANEEVPYTDSCSTRKNR